MGKLRKGGGNTNSPQMPPVPDIKNVAYSKNSPKNQIDQLKKQIFNAEVAYSLNDKLADKLFADPSHPDELNQTIQTLTSLNDQLNKLEYQLKIAYKEPLKAHFESLKYRKLVDELHLVQAPKHPNIKLHHGYGDEYPLIKINSPWIKAKKRVYQTATSPQNP